MLQDSGVKAEGTFVWRSLSYAQGRSIRVAFGPNLYLPHGWQISAPEALGEAKAGAPGRPGGLAALPRGAPVPGFPGDWL